jgi:hypothetical protein
VFMKCATSHALGLRITATLGSSASRSAPSTVRYA